MIEASRSYSKIVSACAFQGIVGQTVSLFGSSHVCVCVFVFLCCFRGVVFDIYWVHVPARIRRGYVKLGLFVLGYVRLLMFATYAC
jgi:hypothetical protein